MTDTAIRLAHISANGLDFHYASTGTADHPLVLFLHGFPEAWFGWEAQLQALAEGDYHAVAPDLPGYNRSDKSKDVRGYRGGVIVRDLAAFVEALGHRQLHLVGHDWGGSIAFALAIARPDLVKSLFIVNAVHPYPFWREQLRSPAQAAHSQYINLFRDPARQNEISHDRFAFLRRMLAGDDGRMPAWFDDATEARYLEAWSQPGALEGALGYYRASPLHPPTSDAAGCAAITMDPATLRVAAPTTILWGERDTALLPGCIEGIEEVVPRVRVVRHAQASHWFVHEYPDFVNQHLREHLATHSCQSCL